MALLFPIGQILRGRSSTYTLVKELHRAVDEAAVYLARQDILYLLAIHSMLILVRLLGIKAMTCASSRAFVATGVYRMRLIF
jgi:hypothetical protein